MHQHKLDPLGNDFKILNIANLKSIFKMTNTKDIDISFVKKET